MSASAPYRRATAKDLLRWGICFVAILSLHGAVAAAMMMQPVEGDTYDEVTAIEVDFSTQAYKDAPQRDVAPGEEQMQADAAPPPMEKAEAQPEEPAPEPPLPPVEEPDVAIETAKTPEKKKEEKKEEKVEKTPNAAPPVIAASTTTAPTSAAVRTARVVSWKRKLARHLQQNKRYPREAQIKRERGSAKVHFVVSREGRIISSSIVKSSGYPALDHEALELLQRAQPLPTPPAELGGTQFAFSVPVVFELK
jgi:protein TonB